MKAHLVCFRAAAAAAMAMTVLGASARAELVTVYVAPEASTNAAYTAENPGGWQGVKAAQAKALQLARKNKVAVTGERIVFKNGVYTGLSLGFAANNARQPVFLEGEGGAVVFDGTGAKARALTMGGLSGYTTGVTFRNYRTEGDGGAVWSGVYSNCVFTANAATGAGGAGAGGARFVGCRFEGNRARTCAAVAGREAWHQKPESRLENCTLKANFADGYDCRPKIPQHGFYTKDTALGLYVSTTNCTFEAKDSSWWHDLTKLTIGPEDDFAAAFARIRRERAPGKPFKVVLKDGLYRLPARLVLGGEDKDLTIVAKHKGKAVLTRGWTFRGKDLRKLTDTALLKRLPEVARDKVYAVDVPAALTNDLKGFIRNMHAIDFMPVLTVDGRHAQVARWPNVPSLFSPKDENLAGYVEYKDNKGGSFSNAVMTLTGGREKRWDLASQKCAMHYRVGGFEATWRRMTPIAKPAGIELQNERWMPRAAGFFINLFEEIDVPGEWCFEPTSDRLVIWPEKPFEDDTLFVLGHGPRGTIAVNSDGVRIENLEFRGDFGWPVEVWGGRGNLVAGCRVTGCRSGVKISGGFDNVVQSCDFEYLYGRAVEISGGDPKKLIEAHNRADNCLMDHCCFLDCGCAHASLHVSGVGNAASHCLIRHTREHAVQWTGLGTVIEYCRMYDTTREYRDSGAMYSGCGFPSHDCHIRYNDVAGSTGQSHGIYPDDFTSGQKIYGNVIRNIGWGAVFLGGGRNNIVSNNVITSTGVMALHNDNRGLFWSAWCKKTSESWTAELVKQLDFIDGPVGKRWPEWKDYAKDTTFICGNVDNEWVNNIIIDSPNTQDQVCLEKYIPLERQVCKGNVSVGLRRAPCTEVWRFGGFTFADLRTTPDKLFRDVPPAEIVTEPGNAFRQWRWRKGDFSPAKDSVLKEIAPGFEPIPWDKIGLYRDAWRDDLAEEPETLACEDLVPDGDAVSTPQMDQAVNRALFEGKKETKITISGTGVLRCWLRVTGPTKCTVNIAGNDFKCEGQEPVKGWIKAGTAMLPTGWSAALLKGDDAETAKVQEIVITNGYDWEPDEWAKK